jgi:hypothetical protein
LGQLCGGFNRRYQSAWITIGSTAMAPIANAAKAADFCGEFLVMAAILAENLPPPRL